jgi:hypothetical protein
MKAPVKWAIVGGVIGVVAGLLTGLSPFALGVGLLLAGAALGGVSNGRPDVSNSVNLQTIRHAMDDQHAVPSRGLSSNHAAMQISEYSNNFTSLVNDQRVRTRQKESCIS